MLTAIGTQETGAVEKGQRRNYQLLTAVADFVSHARVQRNGLQIDALCAADYFQLFRDSVILKIEHRRPQHIGSKLPHRRPARQVAAVGSSYDHL